MALTSQSRVRPVVKHLTRYIAAINNPALGYQTAEEVDADISSMVLQGYRLFATHYLGAQVDKTMNKEYFGLLYVLVLEPGEVERLKKEKPLEG